VSESLKNLNPEKWLPAESKRRLRLAAQRIVFSDKLSCCKRMVFHINLQDLRNDKASGMSVVVDPYNPKHLTGVSK